MMPYSVCKPNAMSTNLEITMAQKARSGPNSSTRIGNFDFVDIGASFAILVTMQFYRRNRTIRASIWGRNRRLKGCESKDIPDRGTFIWFNSLKPCKCANLHEAFIYYPATAQSKYDIYTDLAQMV